jgi:hypothetical protein
MDLCEWRSHGHTPMTGELAGSGLGNRAAGLGAKLAHSAEGIRLAKGLRELAGVEFRAGRMTEEELRGWREIANRVLVEQERRQREALKDITEGTPVWVM